jgi:hypothetical protein
MSALPKTPANLAPFVDVLDVDGAVEFFLTFGGAELYLPQDPKGASEIVELIGIDKTRALAERATAMKARVPTAKRWIAQVLHSKGLPVAKIARKLHVTDVTVRKYVRDEYTVNLRQLDLF